jgi:uncharacterized membrane protein
MRGGANNKPHNERGFILIMMGALIVPLLGILGLAIDSYRLVTAKAEQESNAELAALAAMETYVKQSSASPTRAIQVAISQAERSAGLNRYIGRTSKEPPVRSGDLSKGVAGSVTFGTLPVRCVESFSKCFVRNGTPINAVKIELKDKPGGFLGVTFGRVFGIKEFGQLTSEAIAFYDKDKATRGENPYALVSSQ